MDWTYDEYIDFVNHLFLQEFTDFDYHTSGVVSTQSALEIRKCSKK